ncbi:MAG: hypothetical protein EBS83_13595, partial [Planctomycetia bacterium]|nr:hypothetical protein [Planctomycetia bacterium]
MRTVQYAVALLAVMGGTATITAAEVKLAEAYAAQIHPLVVKTCGECHGAEPKDNDLNLAGFATSESLLARPAVLEHVIERLHIGD